MKQTSRMSANDPTRTLAALQAAIGQAQDRAARAEKWLAQEIEEKLIHPRQ